MANPRRAATVMTSVAAIEADRGPDITKWAIPTDRPDLFEWVPGNLTAADSLNVLGHNGGTIGRWIRKRRADRGANLGDASVTLTVAGNTWRTIPPATLTAARVLTLGATGAVAGDLLLLTRLDLTAFTVGVANGGPAAGTILTLPASVSSWALFYFDAANWLHRMSGAALT